MATKQTVLVNGGYPLHTFQVPKIEKIFVMLMNSLLKSMKDSLEKVANHIIII